MCLPLSSQNNFEDDLLKVYALIKRELDESTFTMSTKDIRKTFARCTWEEDELKNNPYIKTLQRTASQLYR
jgi:hypothetical protein